MGEFVHSLVDRFDREFLPHVTAIQRFETAAAFTETRIAPAASRGVGFSGRQCEGGNSLDKCQ